MRHGQGDPLAWTADVAAASWIASRLHPFLQDVGSIVPVGFEAYARVFHPIVAPAGRLRWSDIAKRNRRIAHAEMQFHMIARPAGQPGPPAYERGDGPEWGSLPLEERRVLVELLRPETATPDQCWFLVWEGYGGVDHRGVSACVELPHRNYLLGHAPIDPVLAPLPRTIELPIELARRQSPNLWWPDDRVWIVATEVDYAWTYVGGSAALIEAIFAEPRLEALRAKTTDKPFYGSDVVNAALDQPDQR